MDSERSILLQKKMMIAMTLAMSVFLGAVVWAKKYTDPTLEISIPNEIPEVVTMMSKENPKENLTKVKVRTQYFMQKTMAKNSYETEKLVDSEEQSMLESIANFNAIKLLAEERKPFLRRNSQQEEENLEVTIAEEEESIVEVAVQEEQTEEPFQYKEVMEVTATAYCLCQKCCGKTPDNPHYGYTASGLRIVPGTGMKVIAVDPTVIPLNSHVYVEGLNGASDYGYAIAADTGGAIKNNKIDLYMDSHSEALKWGRRMVKVYILAD